MNRRFPSLAVLVAFFALSASAAWAGNAKVQVCHIPPGNPGNFHTITISENALQAHLGHGDLAGACFAHCDSLCSDGNACTIDACDASEQCISTHPPVNCDDGSLCTIDSCNPASGCANVPKTCTDGNNCTVDACDPVTGSCVAPPVVCPAGQSCNPAIGLCHACPCVGGLVNFVGILTGQFGTLTTCDTQVIPGIVDLVRLHTADGTFAASSAGSFKGCSAFIANTSFNQQNTNPTDAAACNAFLLEVAAAKGLTCTPL